MVVVAEVVQMRGELTQRSLPAALSLQVAVEMPACRWQCINFSVERLLPNEESDNTARWASAAVTFIYLFI